MSALATRAGGEVDEWPDYLCSYGPAEHAKGEMSSLAKEPESRLLGKDGFGVVQCAHDKQLRRFVAVKVPLVELLTRAEDAAPCFAAS